MHKQQPRPIFVFRIAITRPYCASVWSSAYTPNLIWSSFSSVAPRNCLGLSPHHSPKAVDPKLPSWSSSLARKPLLPLSLPAIPCHAPRTSSPPPLSCPLFARGQKRVDHVDDRPQGAGHVTTGRHGLQLRVQALVQL